MAAAAGAGRRRAGVLASNLHGLCEAAREVFGARLGAEVMARRLTYLFAHGRLVIANSELMWRSKVFVSLREQSRMLARIAHEAPDGIARFEAAAAYALSGACWATASGGWRRGSNALRARSRGRSCPMANLRISAGRPSNCSMRIA